MSFFISVLQRVNFSVYSTSVFLCPHLLPGGPHRLLPTQAGTGEPWEAGEPPGRTDAQHTAQSKVGEQLGVSLKEPS